MANLSDKKREEMLGLIEEIAAGYQNQFGGCGQAVVHAIQKELNLPDGPIAVKVTSFAGLGIVRMSDFCGALFGAVVAIGLACGRKKFEEPAYPEPSVIDETTGNPKSLEVMRKFYRRFTSEFGGTICRDILMKRTGRTYDFGKQEDLKEHKRSNQEFCAEMVGKTARLAAEAILELPRR